MACKPKNKMSQAMRAKQFAPFAALKGFEEALKEKEKVCIEKREISEERAYELNEALKTVSVGESVCVTYYKCGQYQTMIGVAEKFDLTLKYIEVNEEHITFDNIFEIQKI